MLAAVDIEHAVAAYYGIRTQDMRTASRSPDLLAARCMLAYLYRTELGLSLLRIGEVINRDHTTVIHQLRHAAAMLGDFAGDIAGILELARVLRGKRLADLTAAPAVVSPRLRALR